MERRVYKIGLIFAILFIIAMFGLSIMIMTDGSAANKYVSNTVSNADAGLLVYDNTVISGADVRDAVSAPKKVGYTNLELFVSTRMYSRKTLFHGILVSGRRYTVKFPYDSEGNRVLYQSR